MPPAVSYSRFAEELVTDDSLWSEYKRELMPAIASIWRSAFKAGAAITEAARAFDLRLSFKELSDDDILALNSAAESYISTHSDPWWDQLQQSQERILRESIQRARREGLTPKDVARLIAPEFGTARALRVATTEITRLLGAGAQHQMGREGYATWEWRTSADDRVCPLCSPMDGQEFPMRVAFDARHVNCRCWPVPGALDPHIEMLAAAGGPSAIVLQSGEILPGAATMEPIWSKTREDGTVITARWGADGQLVTSVGQTARPVIIRPPKLPHPYTHALRLDNGKAIALTTAEAETLGAAIKAKPVSPQTAEQIAWNRVEELRYAEQRAYERAQSGDDGGTGLRFARAAEARRAYDQAHAEYLAAFGPEAPGISASRRAAQAETERRQREYAQSFVARGLD